MNDNNKRPREGEENDTIASVVSLENEATIDTSAKKVTIEEIMAEVITLQEEVTKIRGLQEKVETLQGRLDNFVGALKPATTHALLETAVYRSVPDDFDDNAKYEAAQQCSWILKALIYNETRPLLVDHTNTKNSIKSWRVVPGIRRLAAKERLPMMVQALVDGLSTFVAEVDAETLGDWDPESRNALVHNNGKQLCNALHVTPSKVDNRGHGHDHDHSLEEKKKVQKLLNKFEVEGRQSHCDQVSKLVEGGKEEEDIICKFETAG